MLRSFSTNGLPPLVTGEKAAAQLDIPIAGIGALVKAGVLRFYRGITFLQQDVVDLHNSAHPLLFKLRSQVPPAVAPPAPLWPTGSVEDDGDDEIESDVAAAVIGNFILAGPTPAIVTSVAARTAVDLRSDAPAELCSTPA